MGNSFARPFPPPGAKKECKKDSCFQLPFLQKKRVFPGRWEGITMKKENKKRYTGILTMCLYILCTLT